MNKVTGIALLREKARTAFSHALVKVVDIQAALREHDDLRSQRDDLLAALKGFVPFVKELCHDQLQCDHEVGMCGCGFRNEVRGVESVIAKVEGRTA